MRTTDTHIYFWGGIYSQWYKSKFVLDKRTYNCAEQYMMAEKARCFADSNALEKIMKTSDPKEQKKIGRSVKNFDPQIWDKVCEEVVLNACLAKFTQNPDLRLELLRTFNKTIAEASPLDAIWGVGLAEDDDTILDEANWRGRNLLGIAVMRARDIIKNNKPDWLCDTTY